MYKNQKVFFENLKKTKFQVTWKYQKKLLNIILNILFYNRYFQKQLKIIPNYLLIVEHSNVYTLGRRGFYKNLLFNKKKIPISKIDRGGDITYHGPGQLVCYPIIYIKNLSLEIKKYLRLLEEVIIQLLFNFLIKGYSKLPETGVWVKNRKICAIGIKIGRLVTMHGFALNVNPNLHYYNNIIPCGIKNKGVTSIKKEKKKIVSMYKVIFFLKKKLNYIFNIKFI
ncbi:lipoyl(octanoyl) transferase LipB [Candidatus Sulcia muelleri]|uniref:lipoyl(octanoyl) transferase LipB n=1 Tax=Candidatus Karelsulcia muelleri TaxID=336810 RepID=UPI001FA1F825|nr:lipoyl(octanoyl) transferase LipB [Candidatus Karelsulcia muelleri]NHU72532.1 lipoyl(octanoyl) transferase LipB [Candidatus Karelsulcia muelleri]